MAARTIDQRGKRGYVVGWLTGHHSRRDLHGAAVTALASLYSHLSMIELRGHPTRRRGAETGGMAVFAHVRCRHVPTLLTDRFGAVVATGATGRDPRVIEGSTEPTAGEMAVAALEVRGDVASGFADSLHSIVANDAKTRDCQRYLTMVHAFRRIPADHRVTGGAVLAGGGMRGALASGSGAVVAARALAQHFAVLKVQMRPK